MNLPRTIEDLNEKKREEESLPSWIDLRRKLAALVTLRRDEEATDAIRMIQRMIRLRETPSPTTSKGDTYAPMCDTI